MTDKTRKFRVEVPALDDVSAADWRDYIRNAVGSWKGQFHPENPLFDLDRDDVHVVQWRKQTPATEHRAYLDGVAGRLLKEAFLQLEEFEDNGMHHPVCDLRQRIAAFLNAPVSPENDQ